ncbi:hypothetical protein PENSPDRAFT_671013 [Peniophora sp. CONT]|nr:hypothetical protein PENSPDRAFT_671013 [Peniophora sp. CONT]
MSMDRRRKAEMLNWVALFAVSPAACPVNEVAALEELVEYVDSVTQETERALQILGPHALVLPPAVLRLVFWYAAVTNPPTTVTSSTGNPRSWLEILRVCRAWYHIALSDSRLMAETYTHRPYQARMIGSLAGDEPLHYDATVGHLAENGRGSSLALRHLLETTDFNRVGRLVLHPIADIEEHIVRLSELSRKQPLLHLTSLTIEAGTRGLVPSNFAVEADRSWEVKPRWDKLIHAPRLKKAIFTNFWIRVTSYELSKLAIAFSADAIVRPSSADILLSLCGGGGAASLRSLDLHDVVHAHQTSPLLDDLDIPFPVLRRVRVYDYPAASADLLSKLVWARDIGVDMRTTLTHDGATEIARLARVFGAGGYRMVCTCWSALQSGNWGGPDDDPPQLDLDITAPNDTPSWIEVVQVFVNQWAQADIQQFELDVSPEMYAQTSCMHWQGLFARLPDLLRFVPAETLAMIDDHLRPSTTGHYQTQGDETRKLRPYCSGAEEDFVNDDDRNDADPSLGVREVDMTQERHNLPQHHRISRKRVHYVGHDVTHRQRAKRSFFVVSQEADYVVDSWAWDVLNYPMYVNTNSLNVRLRDVLLSIDLRVKAVVVVYDMEDPKARERYIMTEASQVGNAVPLSVHLYDSAGREVRQIE